MDNEPGVSALRELPKIQLRNVGLLYGDARILDAVTLDVAPREVVSLLGPSGCGKTTLLHLIAGLLPPSEGEIIVNGKGVEGPGADRAMVFQDDATFPWMRVEQNIEYGLKVKRIGGAVRRQLVDEILAVVGLDASRKLYPRQLSGGMRKRVDLARALAVEPDVLLMDEPYAALDAMTKERLQLEFLAIQEKVAMTVVFVTHDLEEALFVGDRVVTMGTEPGHVTGALAVPFRRPRSSELKLSQEFQALRGELVLRLGEASPPASGYRSTDPSNP